MARLLPSVANVAAIELLSVADHCLRSRDYVNVIIAGKQPALQWLDMQAAIRHFTAGIGIWDWASNDQGGEPDVVMSCCGDDPTSRHWLPLIFSASIFQI
jgi:phosphoketolase